MNKHLQWYTNVSGLYLSCNPHAEQACVVEGRTTLYVHSAIGAMLPAQTAQSLRYRYCPHPLNDAQVAATLNMESIACG